MIIFSSDVFPNGDTRFATVDEVIEMLKKASADGYGDCVVTCNGEYKFAKFGDQYKYETWDKNFEKGTIDFGGYC